MCVLLGTYPTYLVKKNVNPKEKRRKKRNTKTKKSCGQGSNLTPSDTRFTSLGTQSVRRGEVLYKNSFDTVDGVSLLLISRPVPSLSIDRCTNSVLTKFSFCHNSGIDKSCSLTPLHFTPHCFFTAILNSYTKVGTCSHRLYLMLLESTHSFETVILLLKLYNMMYLLLLVLVTE